MKIIILFLSLFLSISGFAEDGEKKVVYKYKQFEKFDFDDMAVEGDDGIPGDISVNSRFQRDFKNELPYRKNFNPEMLKSLDTTK